MPKVSSSACVRWFDLTVIVDENVHSSTSVFASTVKLHSKNPILFLEEFEDLIMRVQCSHSSIDLTFSSGSACATAIAAWGHIQEAIVVTSHDECNGDGERAVYEYLSPKPQFSRLFY
jgi:hypothetical protein